MVLMSKVAAIVRLPIPGLLMSGRDTVVRCGRGHGRAS